jgi:hypothetical protein
MSSREIPGNERRPHVNRRRHSIALISAAQAACSSTSVICKHRLGFSFPPERSEAVAKLNDNRLLALTLRLRPDRNPAINFYPIDLVGGERGTRTLDPSIMSRNRWACIFNHLPHGARCK